MSQQLGRIASLQALVAARARWRSEGRKVVLVNGAFDMLHVGHLRYLEAAKALGDVLIAAVNSDVSVQLAKGPKRPIVPERERLELLAGLRAIDHLTLFDSLTVTPIIQALEPDIHAKGTDYSAATVPERAVVEAHGGRTAICGDPKDHATTDLIAVICARFGPEYSR